MMKLMLGLQVSYDIWPQNGMGLFYNSCNLHRTPSIVTNTIALIHQIVKLQRLAKTDIVKGDMQRYITKFMKSGF